MSTVTQSETKTELQIWVEKWSLSLTTDRAETTLQKRWNTALAELNTIESEAKNTVGEPLAIATKRRAVADIRKAIAGLAKYAKYKFTALEWTDNKKGVKCGIINIGKEAAKKGNKIKAKSFTDMVTGLNYISPSQLKKMHEKCTVWLRSNNYAQRAAAISFFTGRRAIEILKTGEFSGCKGKSLNFHGQAKKHAGEKNTAYRIPTLTNAIALKDSLEGMQGLVNATHNINIEKLNNVEIEAKTNRKLAFAVYDLFDYVGWNEKQKEVNMGARSRTVADVNFHDLRKLYVLQMLKGDANRQKVQRLLGHDTLDTGKHYENWKIKGA